MSVEYVAGDLFVNRYGVKAFAQGCNCRGSMGAGIAVTFKERYPAMAEEYKRLCKAGQFALGDSFLWKDDDQPWVFNLATQLNPGGPANYDAIEQSLVKMREQSDAEDINLIAMPRIGAGYGRLKWDKVTPIIDRIFVDWPGMVYVYAEYIPADSFPQERPR